MYILQRLQHGLSGVPQSLYHMDHKQKTHFKLFSNHIRNTRTYNRLTQFKQSGTLHSAQLKPQLSHISMLQFWHSPSNRDLRVQLLHFSKSASHGTAASCYQSNHRISFRKTPINILQQNTHTDLICFSPSALLLSSAPASGFFSLPK